jgi:hypothetical protein
VSGAALKAHAFVDRTRDEVRAGWTDFIAGRLPSVGTGR